MDNLIDAPKRTTVVVRDLQRSLSFYRDALGLSIYYEGTIDNPGASAFVGRTCAGIHMVVLQCGDAEHGLVGLLDILGDEKPVRNAATDALATGDVILVIPTQQMEAAEKRLLASGAKILLPPTRLEVPNRPEIHEMMVRDPDGMIVNLTQRGPLV